MILEYEHPVGGLMKTLGFPAKLSETPGQLRQPAPTLGQHNQEVLTELGYSAETIARLTEDQVIPDCNRLVQSET
jgi:crotonobetainyl-CoA:carnitine CoA-transferase CaiB-like acyl-CoA transferase